MTKPADIEETWNQVGPGVSHVLEKLEEGLSANDYMGIYTKIHDFCTTQKSCLENARNLETANKGILISLESFFFFFFFFDMSGSNSFFFLLFFFFILL